MNKLGNSKLPYLKDKKEEMQLIEEFEYWNIPLNEQGKIFVKIDDESYLIEQYKFDPEWCASTLTLEKNNRAVDKHSIYRLIRHSTWHCFHKTCFRR